MDQQVVDVCDRIIWTAARKIYRKLPKKLTAYTFGSMSDAHQQGWVYFLKDEKNHNLTLPYVIKYGGLLTTAIYRDLIDHVRSVCGRDRPNGKDLIQKKTQRIFNTASVDNFDFNESENSIEQYERVLTKEIASFMSRCLNVRQNYIARLYFAEGYTQKEIGKKFQMTESRVNQIIKQIEREVYRQFKN